METKKSETDKSQGYILLHRKMMDKPYFTNSQIVHIWVYLLFKTNHKDNYFEMKLIKRGSFATSRKRIAKDTGINESKVERILKMLETEQEIEQQNCGKFRVITIVDWDKFQKVNRKMNNSETMSEQQRNNSETMSEHNIIMNNNVSNDINVNNEIKDIKTIPLFEEFKKYAYEKDSLIDEKVLKFKYAAWVENGWKNGYNKPIKNWKTALLNTIPHLHKSNLKETKEKYNFHIIEEGKIIDV